MVVSEAGVCTDAIPPRVTQRFLSTHCAHKHRDQLKPWKLLIWLPSLQCLNSCPVFTAFSFSSQIGGRTGKHCHPLLLQNEKGRAVINMTWTALLGGEMKSFDSQIFRAKLRHEDILPPKQIQNLVPLCYPGWEEFRWYCPTTKCFASESCSIAYLLMGQSLLPCFSLSCNSHQYVFCLSARPHSLTRRDMHPLLI